MVAFSEAAAQWADSRDSDDEESSVISLCDLPEMSSPNRHSFLPLPDLFEFSSVSLSEEICAADDIFLSGQLLPSKPPPLWTAGGQAKKSDVDYGPKILPVRRRCRSGSFEGLHSLRDGVEELRREESDSRQRVQPRWYLLMFGSVRAPVSMEMRDIRSRQTRQRSSLETEGCEVGRGTWKLLRSLSCRGLRDDNPAIKTPLSSSKPEN